MNSNKLSLKRKTSTLKMSNLSRSTSVAPSSNVRLTTPRSANPSTPRVGHRHTSGGFRTLLDRFRDSQPEFEMLTPPSSAPVPKPPPPQISKLAKAFVDSLNTQQVSDFLTWMLYYDVVELPDSPTAWYEIINSMEMRGWVALGDFLSKMTETDYGFDLIVLDSICDRINLQRTTVHDLLIQFADPKKMSLTQIATTVNAAVAEGKSELEVFEAVQEKLHLLYRLVSNLKPTEGSVYDVWHAVIQKRLRGFLHLVIGPRMLHLRSGAPLITSATSEHLPKEVKDGIKLKYMYEALQQERQVPLMRYGIHSEISAHGYLTPPSSSPPSAVSELGDAELARSHAVRLMKENQDLYAQIAKLTRENEKLVESNENLARKVATLGRNQPASYLQAAPEDSQPVNAPFQSSTAQFDHDENSSILLQVPQPRQRPRSLSHDAGEKLAASLDAKLNISQRTHKRQHSEVLSWKYEDVFSELDKKPLSALRLSDPVTGELVAPITPPELDVPPRHPERAVSYAPDRSRRSGMIFDKGSMAYLSDLGESTPNVHESHDEQDVVDVFTPTPLPRQRVMYE